MGETHSWSPARDWVNLTETLSKIWGTWAMTHLAEILGDLAETLEDLVETLETTGIWPMADPYHWNLADGRSLLQLTLKPKSVKLIHH